MLRLKFTFIFKLFFIDKNFEILTKTTNNTNSL